MALLVSIQVGLPATIVTENPSDNHNPVWQTGFYKLPVRGPVQVGRITIEGDGQADLSVHGGEDRPILAYCAEHYPQWRDELSMPEIPFGAFGENFTISGLDERIVCLGDRYTIGPITVEASQPRQPCWKLARRLGRKDVPARVIEHNRGGWYFRVIEEGKVEPGMSVELKERPNPKWTIRRAMEIMYSAEAEESETKELAELPQLSEQWREYFERRAN